MTDQSLSDRSQQMEACKELAPETLLYHLNQPWKALEYVLRNRNFENKQLLDRVEDLEAIASEQRTLLDECRKAVIVGHSAPDIICRIDELNEKANILLDLIGRKS